MVSIGVRDQQNRIEMAARSLPPNPTEEQVKQAAAAQNLPAELTQRVADRKGELDAPKEQYISSESTAKPNTDVAYVKPDGTPVYAPVGSKVVIPEGSQSAQQFEKEKRIKETFEKLKAKKQETAQKENTLSAIQQSKKQTHAEKVATTKQFYATGELQPYGERSKTVRFVSKTPPKPVLTYTAAPKKPSFFQRLEYKEFRNTGYGVVTAPVFAAKGFGEGLIAPFRPSTYVGLYKTVTNPREAFAGFGQKLRETPGATIGYTYGYMKGFQISEKAVVTYVTEKLPITKKYTTQTPTGTARVSKTLKEGKITTQVELDIISKTVKAKSAPSLRSKPLDVAYYESTAIKTPKGIMTRTTLGKGVLKFTDVEKGLGFKKISQITFEPKTVQTQTFKTVYDFGATPLEIKPFNLQAKTPVTSITYSYTSPYTAMRGGIMTSIGGYFKQKAVTSGSIVYEQTTPIKTTQNVFSTTFTSLKQIPAKYTKSIGKSFKAGEFTGLKKKPTGKIILDDSEIAGITEKPVSSFTFSRGFTPGKVTNIIEVKPPSNIQLKALHTFKATQQAVKRTPKQAAPISVSRTKPGSLYIVPTKQILKPELQTPGVIPIASSTKLPEIKPLGFSSITPIIDIKPVLETRPITTAKPSTISRGIVDLRPVQETRPISETKPILEIKPILDVKPIQEIRPVTQSRPIQEIRPINIIREPPSFSFPPFLPKSTNRKSFPLFQTFIKRYGEYKPIGTPMPRIEAIKFGAQKTRETLAASFKVRPISEPTSTQPTSFNPSPGVFRSYKISKGKKIKLYDEFIQKRGTRLSFGSEVEEIKMARLSSSKNKRRRFLF